MKVGMMINNALSIFDKFIQIQYSVYIFAKELLGCNYDKKLHRNI